MASKKKTETEEARTESTLAAAVAGIDREALAPKTRLYALAKQVGVASKELVAQFAEMGIKKSAQSTLTPEEVGQLIDALVPATEDTNQAAAEDAEQAAVTADAAQTPEEPVEETTEAPAEEKPEKTVKKKRTKRAAKRVSKAGKKAESKEQTQTKEPLSLIHISEPTRPY